MCVYRSTNKTIRSVFSCVVVVVADEYDDAIGGEIKGCDFVDAGIFL